MLTRKRRSPSESVNHQSQLKTTITTPTTRTVTASRARNPESDEEEAEEMREGTSSPVLFSATTFDPITPYSLDSQTPSTSQVPAPGKKRRSKLRNGAACSRCRASKNKCLRSEEDGRKCLRCESYKFDCDATQALAPASKSRKDPNEGSSVRENKRRRLASQSRDPSASMSPSASASPAIVAGPSVSRRPSTAGVFVEPSIPQYRHSQAPPAPQTVEAVGGRSTQSTPSHSSLVDNHTRHVNEEEFTSGTGESVGALYYIPPQLWRSPALAFEGLIKQREEIMNAGEGHIASKVKDPDLESSWYRCMDSDLIKELGFELPMLVNEVLVDRLSAWQYHRRRLSPSQPPSSKLYLYTLMLLATLHNPTLFQPATHTRLKAATQNELLQTILQSLEPSIETALALELLARWKPFPTDGALLMEIALQMAEKVGYNEGSAIRSIESRRLGSIHEPSLTQTKVWYGLKLSLALVNEGLGRDSILPPSNVLAEALGPLDLLTSEGVQDCQLLVRYRLSEYTASMLRLIRNHVEDPEAMCQTTVSIGEYALATIREIEEFADNALANSAAINALKAEVHALESFLVVQLNRRFAGHFRSELNSNAPLRDTLGTDKHTQDAEAIGKAYHLKGWVNAVIFGGERFIEPGCNAVHGYHRQGETPNGVTGHFRSWPRHVLDYVAFSFVVLITAQITSFAYNKNGDGMGKRSDYLDLILEQARHILVQARVPMADVTSSLLEVWQRRKESTARHFRQKARDRRQALQTSRATDVDLPGNYRTPSSGAGSSIDVYTDQQLAYAEPMSAPLFTHIGDLATAANDLGGMQSQQSIDAWFESIFSNMEEVNTAVGQWQ